MLSIENIYREIGKNIFICPLDVNNFRDNSIDLTASKFAWTSEGDYIYNEKDKSITVPKHKTACILTNEAIYVTSKIGGTYHSRVSMVRNGLGHIGTMLDPEYVGQSLIMLHNTTENDIIIKEGERMVSLVFYYLSTPICKSTLPTPPSHLEKVARLDKESRYNDWCNSNPWVKNSQLLKKHFMENYYKEFKEKRRVYAQRKRIYERILSSTIYILILKYLLVSALIFASVFIIKTKFPPLDASGWAAIIIPIVICVIGLISGDIAKHQNDFK